MSFSPNVSSIQSRPAFIAATPVGCRTSQNQSGCNAAPERISRAEMLQSPAKTHLVAKSVIVHPLTVIVSLIFTISEHLSTTKKSTTEAAGSLGRVDDIEAGGHS